MSVHVTNSNYTQISSPHRELVTIPFTQPPTITHTAPQIVSFDIMYDFVYDFETSSELGQQLSYGQLIATPPELSDDANITFFQHDIGVRVMGRISIDATLPVIIQQGIVPSLSITITDAFRGMVIASTRLHINPSPPLFDRPHYVYDVAENTSTGVLPGPIRLIDPNGGTNLLTPMITRNEPGTSEFFSVVAAGLFDAPHAYFSYDMLIQHRFDYEQIERVDFQLVAVDAEDDTLTSTATVRVNILPVNEFSPRFVMTRLVGS